MIDNINLFWGTRALTKAREDHMTEFFAALLVSDSNFRQKYEDYVLAAHASRLGWKSHAIAKVETQVAYPEMRPDMRLTTQDGHIVICEHKIEAAENMGSEDDPRRQLTRYLALPVDGLVYVRASWKPLGVSVISDPKYIRPGDSEREHFLWADFHAALQAGQTPLAHWMRESFNKLGYTPAHPSLGDLSPASPGYAARRDNFFKLIEPLRIFARGLGWVPVKGVYTDIWLQGSPQPMVHTIRIDVTSNLLNIKIVPSGGATPATLREKLCGVLAAESRDVVCEEAACMLPSGKAEALVISIPITDLLASISSVGQIQDALKSHAAKYIESVTRE